MIERGSEETGVQSRRSNSSQGAVMAGHQSGVRIAEEGVYYRAQDYAGFFRRLAIDLIDVAAVSLVWFVLAVVVLASTPEDKWGRARGSLLLLLMVMAFAYFVLLKRSAIRTLGYRVCRAEIVSLQGLRPGVCALTLRLLFSVIGPLNLLLDLVWIPSDAQRQALRDKFAHTYVVKAGSTPEGRGKVVYANYHILNTAFIFAEVRPDATSGAP